MPVLGLRGTGSWVANVERPTNFRELILYLYPNGEAPFTALLSKLRSEATNDPLFNWFEKQTPTQEMLLNGALAGTTATSIPVRNNVARNVKQGHVILNTRTLEQMLVVADPSVDTAITVIRAWGETAAAAMNDNDTLLVIGSAYQEGDSTPSSVAYVPTRQYNYAQIFRTSLNITRTAKRTRLRTGEAIKEAKREALMLHAVEMERAFLFGQRFEDLTGPQPRRATRGIRQWVATNYNNFAGSITETQWENYLEGLFRYGSNEKLALCGSTALNVLNQLAKNKGKIDLEPASNTYGMSLLRYVTPFGQLLLRQHPLFNLSAAGYRQSIAFIDCDKVTYRYVDDTDYIKNRQSPGADASLDEFLTEAGFELHFEAAHGWADNMATFVP
jgi:hypothetical protein